MLRRVEPRAELALWLAEALYRMGEPAEAEQVAARALAAGPEPGLLVELHRILVQCQTLTGQSEQALPALTAALDTPGLTAVHRARLQVLAARVHRILGQVDEAESLASTVLEMTDDRAAVGWALHVLTLLSMMRGQMAEALPLFERALAVTEETDLRLLLRINQSVTLGDLDRYDEAKAALTQVRDHAERSGSIVRLTQAHSAMGQLLWDTGGWDDALAEVDVVPVEVKDPAVVCCDQGVAAVIAFHRGDPVTGRVHLAAAAPRGGEDRAAGGLVAEPCAQPVRRTRRRPAAGVGGTRWWY